jgi:hypothetical protein
MPGYTMTRQGPERAIGRLHPEFVKRLAAAIAEARGAGLPFAGIFSDVTGIPRRVREQALRSGVKQFQDSLDCRFGPAGLRCRFSLTLPGEPKREAGEVAHRLPRFQGESSPAQLREAEPDMR